MKFRNLLFIIAFSISSVCAVSASVVPRAIYVKFKPGHLAAREWLGAGRHGECPSLVQALGRHTSEPMISDGVVQMLHKNPNKNIKPKDAGQESIELIALIKFEEDIPPAKAAQAVATIDGVEYAEPVPEHTFFGDPNDTYFFAQYYIKRVNAIEACEVINSTDTLIVGVVDTGVDYLHEDLAANIWTNPGETGIDKYGRDKRTNGIDDDNNGFVDDWHGWDFLGASGNSGDNNPAPGNPHGTHVAGTIGAVINNGIGIAGVAKNVKILPVKCAYDAIDSRSIDRGYDGILYASLMGAKVINCSWGGGSYSLSEQSAINLATSRGSLVVCAAGNDNKLTDNYPASYTNAMSVAALNSNDEKASFSNYCSKVSVSAPGTDILATMPSNRYNYMSGTSMASPIVAAVAALVRLRYPNMTPLQVCELIKASSDNVDSVSSNLKYAGKIGRGCVNAYRAVTEKSIKSVILDNSKFYCTNDSPIESGKPVLADIGLRCILSPVSNLKAFLYNTSQYNINFSRNMIDVGDLGSGESVNFTNALEFTVNGNISDDATINLVLRITGNDGYSVDIPVSFVANPSYLTMRDNNLRLTLNSRGNYSYNDFPSNQQGAGFQFKSKGNMLYEGAFMAGQTARMLSSVARSGTDGSTQDHDFYSQRRVGLIDSALINANVAHTSFSDDGTAWQAGIHVDQTMYQFRQEGHKNYIIASYDIKNLFNADLEQLYAGLYLDWDIGLSGKNNMIKMDGESIAYAYNAVSDTLPYAAVAPLSDEKLNIYAIDNNGNNGGISIYDGFSMQEKWLTLSSGLARTEAGPGDVSLVIANGPFSIKSNETKRIAFVILAGDSLPEIREAFASAQRNARKLQIINFKISEDKIVSVSPNPSVLNQATAIIDLKKAGQATLEVFNMLGMRMSEQILNTENATELNITLNAADLPIGAYILRLRTDESEDTYPFVVNR